MVKTAHVPNTETYSASLVFWSACIVDNFPLVCGQRRAPRTIGISTDKCVNMRFPDEELRSSDR